MEEDIILPKSGNIVVLTGSGISAESGISTFRSKGGIWQKYDIRDVATAEAYIKNPELVQSFYNARRKQLADPMIQPNKAHRALARLEKTWGNLGRGEMTIITQNVDDLHERAGSERILHMHGELKKIRCLNCSAVMEWSDPILAGEKGTPCPGCYFPGKLRPHIVWFGEIPFHLEAIDKSIRGCSLFISIGTSGTVYPAGQFAAEAKLRAGALTVELNLEPSGAIFDICRYGEATEKVPRFVDELLAMM